MRIRRKKHLEERLSEVNEYLITPERDIVNVKQAVLDKRYLDYERLFNNDNPVELEIGCGKGGFICQKAMLNPNANFIAVELLENIIVMACENAKKHNLKNVKFLNSGAEYLPRYIPDESIKNIYLNFSPPYPQKSYENRRLTCNRHISAYKNFLITGGTVYQKTDDKGLFEYSMEKFIEPGFNVLDLTNDLN
ncbi:MAG: tRNA (guanosine(46)-N7)-methyltransferase TrmB, partial [Clostridia bacterium]|nr:tRNA (guanosine(46)-N7)-methyltransferase TrmB [Clostridia bacterium]